MHSLVAICFALACLTLAGCAKSESDQAFDSDANGYMCRKCRAKFSTARSVFAERCPECGAGEITEVMAFVCPADKTVILAPRGLDAVPCTQCGKLVREVKLPQAAELKAWGAAPQPEENVMTSTP